jgi:hypothetical protein
MCDGPIGSYASDEAAQAAFAPEMRQRAPDSTQNVLD